MANPHTNAQWEAIIRDLVARQPYDDQGVYFQVTRGVAKRDHAFPKGVPPTVFMMSNPLPIPTREQVEDGVAVVTADDNRWHRCDLKTISLLGNVLMRQLATDRGAVETVMFRDGYLTEASASNVLIVKDGTLIVPPKDNHILPGITYDATMEFARDAGVPLVVRPVPKDEALAADEMWLSSSTKEVLAITTVDGKPFARGQARPGLPQAVGGIPGEEAARAPPKLLVEMHPRSGCDSSQRSSESGTVVPKWPWWNTSPLPFARSQVTTSPTNSDVIARADLRVMPALEPRGAARDQRRVRPAHPEVDAGKPVGVRAREAAREIGLRG